VYKVMSFAAVNICRSLARKIAEAGSAGYRENYSAAVN